MRLVFKPWLLIFALLGLSLSNSLTAYALSGPYPASEVLGQNGFTTNTGAAGTDGLDAPWGSTALDSVHHRLFVSDTGNQRVLVYDLSSTNDLTSSSASYELGQTDFLSHISGYNANQMYDPTGLAYDSVNNRLFVENGEEVDVFDLANGITSGMSASYELGQPAGFGNDNCYTTQNGVCDMYGGVSFDPVNDRLFVLDTDNYRVLVFNVNPSTITTGENADHVLGQQGFLSYSTTASQNTFAGTEYSGMAFDSTRQILFVADTYDNRVLVFNLSNGITDGMNASYVLGQNSWSSTGYGTTQNSFYYPTGLGYDPVSNTLYVDDGNENCRIMIFNLSAGISSDMNATGVLGATDFNSTDCGLSQTQFSDSYSDNIAVDGTNGHLYLPSYGGSRVLIYDFVHITTTSLPEGSVGASYNQSLATSGYQGILTYSITGGSLPPGLSLNPSTGVISGTATTPGTYTFEISVSDNVGLLGTYTQDPSYTITIPGPSSPAAPDTGFAKPKSDNLLILITMIVSITGLAFGLRAYRRKS
jgi:sugar lactone lactonase YvrE